MFTVPNSCEFQLVPIIHIKSRNFNKMNAEMNETAKSAILGKLLTNWTKERIEDELNSLLHNPKRIEIVIKNYLREQRNTHSEDTNNIHHLFPNLQYCYVEKLVRKYGKVGALKRILCSKPKRTKHAVVSLLSDSDDDVIIEPNVQSVEAITVPLDLNTIESVEAIDATKYNIEPMDTLELVQNNDTNNVEAISSEKIENKSPESKKRSIESTEESPAKMRCIKENSKTDNIALLCKPSTSKQSCNYISPSQKNEGAVKSLNSDSDSDSKADETSYRFCDIKYKITYSGDNNTQSSFTAVRTKKEEFDEEQLSNDSNYSDSETLQSEVPVTTKSMVNENILKPSRLSQSLHEINVEKSKENNKQMNISHNKSDVKMEAEIYLNEMANVAPNELCSHIMELFPDASSSYLKLLCNGRDKTAANLEDVTNHLLNSNYPKREVQEKFEEEEISENVESTKRMLEDIFPNADSGFLQYKAEELAGNKKELENFINAILENHNYPTKEDIKLQQKLSSQVKQYTDSFDAQEFLNIIPNPREHYKNSLKSVNNYSEKNYVSVFFRNYFDRLSILHINNILRSNYHAPFICYNLLRNEKPTLKCRRKPIKLPEPPQNIILLQELAYIEHYPQIMQVIEDNEKNIKFEFDMHKKNGTMETCNCCYDSEILPMLIITCNTGCKFCNTCVQKSIEVAFGEGKLEFPCLRDCSGEFPLTTLQSVLAPNLFSKIAQKKQLEEIKAAGIEDLESCPFCDFVSIPSPTDKLFKCLNPECMKESCRECKNPSHVPLRCEEVEKDEEVKKRTYIEDRMTKALLRECYKCQVKFIKLDGCNKMTCKCGATMCYVCKQPVKDYKHFNGQGGDQHHLCPLYSDTHQLHEKAVLNSAQEAKQELGIANEQLKHDPTIDIKDHYKEIRKKTPVIPHVPAQLLPGAIAPIVQIRQDQIQNDNIQPFPVPW